MNAIKLLAIFFETRISDAEVPYLRGNMIRLSGGDSLFHNHHAEGFRYSYPLVQYKRIDGCAAVVGINQGADALAKLLDTMCDGSFRLGNRAADMGEAVVRLKRFSLAYGESGGGYTYRISRWMPLNGDNYRAYQQADSLAGRISMLEGILVGNILSFAKGVGVFLEHPVTCSILQLEPSGLARYKDVELMTFSATFRCNVSLPEYIGLGKAASTGHGTVVYGDKL